ncbi:MarR family winged helix-turn-helix transcriptional regulator [Solitalea lacus]|uniref:MarR family winged helix-turn-helix transcriptional regulator n=1 Tax=Solitalea lacus TaxID=2911172 RepID=UPI001EDB646F|nr:MarR family transcriptional regulator [Solitalea lacus]UKJ09172.1 MarR family transcriptional regulator [Solitalea lacus]
MKIEKEILQEDFGNSHQKAVINLMFTHNWVRDKLSGIFKTYDILPQHYNVLRILKGKHPQPVSPGQIKDVMIDKGNDVTRLLDKLVTKGFVKRCLCEENRRKMDITITEAGLKLLDELSPFFDEFYQAMKGRLNENDAELLSDLLDKLRD